MAKTYIAPSAVIVADVVLEEEVNIWHGAVLRGDCGAIRVGAGTNIQDHCVLHEETTVGAGCSIGHGAILLNGAVIGEHCLIGAGAVVTGKMNAPAGSLILGNPAQVVKPLSQDQIDYIHKDAAMYLELAKQYLD